ncbi:MAG: hypothetical protein M3Q69_08085, partial [Acidobacteriota bacterium]|nr:hypothetical protein [Acidobacteriota bacterium]
MHRSLIVALTLVVSLGAFAQEQQLARGPFAERGGLSRGCGTYQPSLAEAEAMEAHTSRLSALLNAERQFESNATTVTVMVYFHV